MFKNNIEAIQKYSGFYATRSINTTKFMILVKTTIILKFLLFTEEEEKDYLQI